MGIEEKLPSGVLLTTVEGVAGYMRKASFWPATFGLACCAIEMMTSGGPKYDLARFGMEVFRASPRQADLMIVAGRVARRWRRSCARSTTRWPSPKWVLAMGVCASSGGMFNNYAVVQGVDHVVPVDMYLPGCPPRPEMLIDAILKLHDQVQHTKLGANRRAEIESSRPRRCTPSRPPRCGASSDEHDKTPQDADPPTETSRPRTSRRPPARSQVGVRHGMFGIHGTGDTSGYGGLTQAITYPGDAQRPYGGWFDEVADALEQAGRDAGWRSRRRAWSSTAARSPSTYAARTSRSSRRCCATTRGCASSSAPVSAGCTTPPTPVPSCTRSTTCSR